MVTNLDSLSDITGEYIMINPSYLITVHDHDGNAWEVDINNEDNLERLLSIRSIITDKIVSINYQLKHRSNDENKDWQERASLLSTMTNRNLKHLDRRIKFLKDPDGTMSEKNKRFNFYQSRKIKDFNFIVDYLTEKHPAIFNKIISEMETNP